MDEQRLIEITSTIVKLDGPMTVALYLLQLGQSDYHLFCNCIKSSKHANEDWYVAMKKFSEDYLQSKNLFNIEVYTGGIIRR